MDRILALAFAATLCFSSLATAQPGTDASSSVEKELIALDTKVHEAGAKGDTSVAADVFTEDFVQATGTALRTKSEVLKGIASAKPLPAGSPTPAEPTYTVRVHGDTAILTHVTRYTDPHEPGRGNGTMHVFVKQQGDGRLRRRVLFPLRLRPSTASTELVTI